MLNEYFYSHLDLSLMNMYSTPMLLQYVSLSLFTISLSGRAVSLPPMRVVFGRVNICRKVATKSVNYQFKIAGQA